MSKTGEDTFQAHEQYKGGSSHYKVKTDFGLIPAGIIGPGVKQGKGHAPAKTGQEIGQSRPAENGYPGSILGEHQGGSDWQQNRHKILCSHVLSDVDVKGNKAAKIADRRCKTTDKSILLTAGYSHKHSSFLLNENPPTILHEFGSIVNLQQKGQMS